MSELTPSARGRIGRRVLASGVAAIAALGIAACGSSSGGSGGNTATNAPPQTSNNVAKAPGNPTKGTINWWASPISTSGPDVRKVWISAFEKAYPGIKVKLISAPTDTDTNRATLTTQISGGAGPDVFMGDVIWPAQFGAHQLAVPLSKYLPSSYFTRFASGLVQGATYKGQVYGAPLFEDQGFLYYRKDLLAKDHMKVPTNWEQLMSDSKEMQSKKQVQYGYVFQGADYEGATCNFMEFLGDAGGEVLNADGNKSLIASNDGALKALTFMRSLVSSGVSPSAVSTFQEPQALSVFTNGNAAFLRNWDYAYAASQASGSKVIGKVGVAPMPTFAGKTAPGYSNIGGWNLYINPHSQEHRRRPHVHQVDDERRGPEDPGDEVLADPDDQLGPDRSRRGQVQRRSGDRAQDQADPAPGADAELPAGQPGDLSERELGAGGSDVAGSRGQEHGLVDQYRGVRRRPVGTPTVSPAGATSSSASAGGQPVSGAQTNNG